MAAWSKSITLELSLMELNLILQEREANHSNLNLESVESSKVGMKEFNNSKKDKKQQLFAHQIMDMEAEGQGSSSNSTKRHS